MTEIVDHSIEAEQSLLGAILMNNEAFAVAEIQVEADHFYEAIHRDIFKVCAQLIRKGKLATPITLRPFLPNTDLAPNMTTQQYLARLAAEATTIINARDFAQTIRHYADQRAVRTIAQDMQPLLGDDPLEAAAWGVEQLDSIISARAHMQMPSLMADAAVTRAVDSIAKAYANDGQMSGIPTGLRALDSRLSGLQRGELVVLAARPSMGKAQPLSARVRAEHGWMRMGDVGGAAFGGGRWVDL